MYYFEYDDQIFSPIAQRVYELQAAAVIVEDFDIKEEAPDWCDAAGSDLEEADEEKKRRRTRLLSR